MHNFPDVADPDDALFYIDPKGLLLSIEARASGADGVGVDVLAQLSNFGLNLFPGASLMKIGIDRLSFRSSNGRKPEVDVVMNDMQWQGVLAFIQTLEELIPMDGFSDPPYVDVAPSGIKAGFDLALPSLAIGVFSLENMSLGADVSIPFLGDAVTVGFYFCTREKPFRLTVMCVGGGGFVGIRLSPKGLVLLEMSWRRARSWPSTWASRPVRCRSRSASTCGWRATTARSPATSASAVRSTCSGSSRRRSRSSCR